MPNGRNASFKSTHYPVPVSELYGGGMLLARASAPTLITGMEVGGQMSITTDVENYPGFADVIQGPWLMEQMHAQAEHVGTKMINDLIVDVNFTQRPFVCEILATAIRRTQSSFRPVRSALAGDWKRNRSFRALAYPPARPVTAFYREKEVAVIGGGNTAVEEALSDQPCDQADPDPSPRLPAVGENPRRPPDGP